MRRRSRGVEVGDGVANADSSAGVTMGVAAGVGSAVAVAVVVSVGEGGSEGVEVAVGEAAAGRTGTGLPPPSPPTHAAAQAASTVMRANTRSVRTRRMPDMRLPEVGRQHGEGSTLGRAYALGTSGWVCVEAPVADGPPAPRSHDVPAGREPATDRSGSAYQSLDSSECSWSGIR